MPKMTRKQEAAEEARNASKVFQVEVEGTIQTIFQVHPATEARPNGVKTCVAEVQPNYGAGAPLCVLVPERDAALAYAGNGLTLGFLADDMTQVMDRVRRFYSN